jgi:hypothetical protein
MAINYSFRNGACSSGCNSICPDEWGCPPDQCPDFVIRRHDTKPAFKISVEDCEGPLDIQGLIVEMSMWAKAKLKSAITIDDTYFGLANGIGFQQIMVGDIIVMDRVRTPEYMLVEAFDEENKLILVQRGYRGTPISNWKKGSSMKIFRILNAPAQTEIILEDISYPDGTTERDTLTASYLVYEWRPEDTCLPGCYWAEFKLIKMKDLVLYLPGGVWGGPVTLNDNGFYYTGSTITGSSVKLSYDSVNDKYRLPTDAYVGDYIIEEYSYYTGSSFNDGSVILNRTDVPVDPDTIIGPNGSSNISLTMFALDVSITPSFTPSTSMSPSDINSYYGCLLGEGVEWSRKFPVSGEGFLIKIEDSSVREF